MTSQDRTRAPEATAAPRDGRRAAIALATIVTCQLMVALDGNIVNIALPQIQEDLHFSATGLAWVFSAYSLAFGGLLLLGGKTSDLLGRRRMFTTGLAVVVLASLLGGLATTPALLIAARALQGAGFAFAAPAALSLLVVTFREGPERNRALGVFSMVAGLGITLGLILGGLLTTVSWRLVFLVNIPIGITAIALARPYLTETPRHPGRLDLLGALTSTLGMTALVYGLLNTSHGWTAPATLAAFAAGVILLGAFVLTESRIAHPLLPLRLLRDPARAGAYASFLLVLATMGGTYFLLSLHLQDALDMAPWQAGFAFLAMAIPQFLAARNAPKLIGRFGIGPVLTTGLLLMIAHPVWLAFLTGDSGYAAGIAGPLVLLGAGLGLSFVPLNMTVLAGLAPQDTGSASGLLQALQQLGLSLGVAILATLYGSALHPRPDTADMADALASAAIAAIVFSTAALAITLLTRRKPATRA